MGSSFGKSFVKAYNEIIALKWENNYAHSVSEWYLLGWGQATWFSMLFELWLVVVQFISFIALYSSTIEQIINLFK